MHTETCGNCGVEVTPQEALLTRTALEHATIEQRGVLVELFNGQAPALLCAGCFGPTLATVNEQVLARQSAQPH